MTRRQITRFFGPHHCALCCYLILLNVYASSCMQLDGFIFRPEKLAADDNPFQHTAIPKELIKELPAVYTPDGVGVNTWVLMHEEGDPLTVHHQQPTILYCHGNRGNLRYYARRIEGLWQKGYGVITFDYRGFGKSSGTPSEEGLFTDIRSVADTFGIGAKAPAVFLYGFSLGTSVCSKLAAERPIAGLILEAPFLSMERLAADATDLSLPLAWFSAEQFNTEAFIGRHQGKLMLIHGREDRFIPSWHSDLLHTLAQQHRITTEYWNIDYADHVTCPCVDPKVRSQDRFNCPDGISPTYQTRVAAFIDATLDDLVSWDL